MKRPKLAIALALVTLTAATQAVAQVAPTAVLRQPGAMIPVSTKPAFPQATATSVGIQQPAPYASTIARPGVTTVTPAIQQPAPYASTAAQPATPAVATVVQQPAQYSATNSQAYAQPTVPVVQQPAPYATVAAQPVVQPTAPPVEQPTTFAPPPVPAANAVLQQPSAMGPPVSGFASYYDDDDEEDDDEEDEEDDELGDDSCGDDLGCGDTDCEASNTCCGFELGGWIQQGFTYNPYDPADGNNGTVILNDLANQYMMNQLWFYANRDVDTGGCGWDWGGRFDVLFGTDAEYFQMQDGLEESWDQTGHYQVAILRFYYDIAYNDWTFRIGRWDTPVGYEPYDATESFFYSRSYNFFAQPGSLLGMFLTRNLGDQASVSAGVHRGDAQFDDTDGKNALGFVGGFSLWTEDEETWFDAYMQTDEEGIGVDAIDYSLIAGTALAEDWDYVAEWYWGQNDQFGQQSDWYGLNQHFTHEINECWSHGFRFEWFRDDDGFIITNFKRGNSAQGPFNGNFFEATYAINYRPCENFVLRPEVRYDWFDASAPSPHPFDDGTENDQFLLSIDAIYAF